MGGAIVLSSLHGPGWVDGREVDEPVVADDETVSP
jgi:hypothetical protein